MSNRNLTNTERRALHKRGRQLARKAEEDVVIIPSNEFDDGDNRPPEDPIQVKGQNYVAFSFMVDKESFEKNGGLVDPYNDIVIKFSGAFKTLQQSAEWNRRLAKTYNERHENKLYHQLFNCGMYNWSLLPNVDVVVEDEDNPENVRPLVPLEYDQYPEMVRSMVPIDHEKMRLSQIMKGVTRQQAEDKDESERRIEETQLLANEGKTTVAELNASKNTNSAAIENSNIMKLIE